MGPSKLPFNPACLAATPPDDLAILPLSAHAVAMGVDPSSTSAIPTATHLAAFGFAIGSVHNLRQWSLSLLPSGQPGVELLASSSEPQASRPGGHSPKNAIRTLGAPLIPLPLARSLIFKQGALRWVADNLAGHIRHHRSDITLTTLEEYGPFVPWLSMETGRSNATSLRSILILEAADAVGSEVPSKANAWRPAGQRLGLEAIFLHWQAGADPWDVAIARCPMDGHAPLHEDDLGMGPFNPSRLEEIASMAGSSLSEVVVALSSAQALDFKFTPS